MKKRQIKPEKIKWYDWIIAQIKKLQKEVEEGGGTVPDLQSVLDNTPFIDYSPENKKGIQYSGIPNDNDLEPTSLVPKRYVDSFLTTITGYDAGETQTLKHVSGVFQWVTD